MAEDTAMDSGRDIQDSRKRPLDGDVENGTTKRSHYGGGNDATYHFKILVPSVAAGAIIGKGGETIAQLQKDSGARVKMSKANDFYPGTQERVCLITGTVEAIKEVLWFIMEKIREKPEMSNMNNSRDYETKGDRDKQVKILVPNSTAGMIIGKGGTYIKQIKEESGSYVQISQKARDQTLQERCITVVGDFDGNKSACCMILNKVVDDPQSGSCPNVSYADVAGPVANFNPTGSPYANQSQQTPLFGTSAVSLATSLNTVSALSGILLNGTGNLNLSLNLGNPAGAGMSLTNQILDSIKVTLRSSGYSDQATAEIVAAMTTLARYGILGMGLGLTGGGTPNSRYLLDPSQTANGPGGGAFGPIGAALNSTSPTPRTGDGFVDPYDLVPFTRRQSGPSGLNSPISVNNNSFGLGTSGQGASKNSVGSKDNKGDGKTDVEIGENIVGAILGPGGRALVEIQHYSGATIQISKKGIFAPGTRNRIVTITGLPNAIQTAKILIEQRIAEEEAKRARQNALGLLQ